MSRLLPLWGSCIGNPGSWDDSKDNAQASCRNQTPRKHGLPSPMSDGLTVYEHQSATDNRQCQTCTDQS